MGAVRSHLTLGGEAKQKRWRGMRGGNESDGGGVEEVEGERRGEERGGGGG